MSPWRVTGQYRVTLVEDEPLFRELLQGALEQTGQITVMGSYGSPADTLSSLAIGSSDAALLDIDLGGEDGIRLGRILRERHPQLGIVLLSNHAHLAFARELIDEHLTGWAYLLKKSVRDVQTILRAIEGTSQGHVVLDPQLTHEQVGDRFTHLTARQVEIWSLITQGYSNVAIAARLGLSGKWVENAVGSLYAALNIDTRDAQVNARVSAALRYAQAAGSTHLTVRGNGELGD